MKKNLTLKETLLVASMFFGMLFGAGNIIFPIHMGQQSGENFTFAVFGFIITAVGLPLLGIISMGLSKKDNLLELSSLIGDKYKYIFTIIVYLTIGPLFAIPRCATTSFAVGMSSFVGADNKIALLIFSFLFFLIVLILALKPNQSMNFIGRFLNPAFLIFLFILIFIVLFNPLEDFSLFNNNILPTDKYSTHPFFNGFLEGYNTMDAIASLAFGITVIEVIKSHGIKDDKDVIKNIISSGSICCIMMAIIYILTTYIGVKSRIIFPISENGGVALSLITNLFLSKLGNFLLLIIITLACLKTSLGLIVSCSEMFNTMFPKFLSIKQWAVVFTLFSFIISNFGLNNIIEYSIPMLMFLYPLVISIMLLSIFGQFFNYNKTVFVSVTAFSIFAAFFDFVKTLPQFIIDNLHLDVFTGFAEHILPFYNIGLGWVVPTVIGFIVGSIIIKISNVKNK